MLLSFFLCNSNKSSSPLVSAPSGSITKTPCDGRGNCAISPAAHFISIWDELYSNRTHYKLISLSISDINHLCLQMQTHSLQNAAETSVEDISRLCSYEARLPVMQSVERVWFQSFLFQSLSEKNWWLQVVLQEGRTK